MKVEELAVIAANLPYDAEVRFTCKRSDNTHDDYYEIEHAYFLQFKNGENPECALYLTGKD